MTLFGPDGATYQKGIKLIQADWDAIDFLAWRCVTEAGALDDTWLSVKAEAEQQDKPLLAYSFLSADPRNLDEAVARTIIDKTIPVEADWEKTGCTFDEMLTWVHDLRDKGYMVPVLYTGKAFWQANGSPRLDGYGFDLAVARYGNQGPTSQFDMRGRYAVMNGFYGADTWKGFGGLDARFWQYSSRVLWGDRYMDMNAFEGDRSELAKYFKTWHQLEDTVLNPPAPAPITIIPSGDDDMNQICTIEFQGKAHLFMRAFDGSLGHVFFEADGEHVQNHGGKITSAPSALVSADGNTLYVFARGEDGHLWQVSYVNGEPAWSGWSQTDPSL